MILPAEWHKQECVQLTWPHKDTDWAPIYDEVIECYCNIAREISLREALLIAAQYPEEVYNHLAAKQIPTNNITIVKCSNNDTWARDHAFISCIDNDKRYLLDFQFNGWGLKFASNLDNQINTTLFNNKVINGEYVNHLDFVLEGGSIESDGMGTILTTSTCLLAPNRNALLTRKDIETQLCNFFNAKRILWLEHSWLAGDDTDGHIDTVARLCPNDTITYVQCTDKEDEHYAELSAMENELKQFKTIDNKPYRLIPLPLPRPCIWEDTRLPATYANFLIINGAVLYPTYSQPDLDLIAKEQLQLAFPNYEIIGIECNALIKQHGSLHCCTMQYPTCV